MGASVDLRPTPSTLGLRSLERAFVDYSFHGIFIGLSSTVLLSVP